MRALKNLLKLPYQCCILDHTNPMLNVNIWLKTLSDGIRLLSQIFNMHQQVLLSEVLFHFIMIPRACINYIL